MLYANASTAPHNSRIKMIAGHDSEIQTGESVADIMLYRVASDVFFFLRTNLDGGDCWSSCDKNALLTGR